LKLLPIQSTDNLEKFQLEKSERGARVNCQLLRSVSSWSAGIPSLEQSIYKAYLTAISEAKHFIYIENQYFISSIDTTHPKNRIIKALYKRLHKAISEHETFRVIIILPEFPSGILQNNITLYMIKFHYRAISREGCSLLEQLAKDFPSVDLSEYISFHYLRNWGYHNNIAATEHIYIHAKIAIIDDRIAIIGSANINDRSLRGSRDSELAVFIQNSEHHMINSEMAGSPFKVSQFAHDFRMRLWRDFLGLSADDDSILDPVCPEVYRDMWLGISRRNTEIYKSVFAAIPDNVTQLSDFENKTEPNNPERLKNVQGYLVDFPLDFLKDEKRIYEGIISKEVMPTVEIAL